MEEDVENRGMRVNMNETKWRRSEASAEGCKMAVWSISVTHRSKNEAIRLLYAQFLKTAKLFGIHILLE